MADQDNADRPDMNDHPVESAPFRSTLSNVFHRVRASAEEVQSFLSAVNAPYPDQTGDGSRLPNEPPDDAPEMLAEIARGLVDLGFDQNIVKLIEAFEDDKLGIAVNDREYAMEAVLQAAAKLGTKETGLGPRVSGAILTQLYNDLQHPPRTLLTEEHRFREPDGSWNNPYAPDVGKAGMTYARTVPPKASTVGQKPDPGVLFDALLAREKPTEHPNQISSVLFYFASIIIHDLFRTDHTDFNISATSSYLDLAPLYGSSWKDQKRVRTMKDGKLKPDCFSETRLLAFPPGVGVLLIMFNRYHNYIVENLALINEDGRFTERSDPNVERYGEMINRRDDDLFQTARLITCGMYINIILIDYVGTILNLNKTNSDWYLNPRSDTRGLPPIATGNQVSAEFNLVYRWHAAISDRDDKWTQELYEEIFQKDYNDVSMSEMLTKLGQMGRASSEIEPEERPFPALQRQRLQRESGGVNAGKFKDDDLAAILIAGVEDCANAFGPRQVPLAMRTIEILGIQQSRSWHLATLNEFRKYFKLRPHRTFEDITQNKEVSEALRHLYDTPDNVELYPGLIVEDAKHPMQPGSGLCGGFTNTRAILSDAVALVRGDRFFTTDYTPALLTNWGYAQSDSDPTIDHGRVIYKLILRAFPYNFKENSIYAHYPFTLPDEMKVALRNIDVKHGTEQMKKYDFKEPKPLVQTKIVFGYESAKRITDDKAHFAVAWTEPIKFLMGPRGSDFCMAGDHLINLTSREQLQQILYLDEPREPARRVPVGNEKWFTQMRSFYTDITETLLEEKSYTLGNLKQVDLIRDVVNMAHVRFAAAMFAIPLKTRENPHGIFTEDDLYQILAGVFITIFFDTDPPSSFPLRQRSRDGVRKLQQVVEMQVRTIAETGSFGAALERILIPQNKLLESYGVHVIQQMCKQTADVGGVVANLMGIIASMVANQGQLLAQCLDYFFSSDINEGTHHWKDINELAKQDTPEADDKIMRYFMEAARMNGETGLIRIVDTEEPITIEDKNGEHTNKFQVEKGDKVLVDLKAVHRDPDVFPDPDTFKLDRPPESYIIFGWGPHQCLGMPMTKMALSTMLKTIGKLDNLRPAQVTVNGSSQSAQIKKTIHEFFPGSTKALPESWHYHTFMTEKWDLAWPFPSSLRVNWDGPLPGTPKAIPEHSRPEVEPPVVAAQ